MSHLAALLAERVTLAQQECKTDKALQEKARQHFLDALAAVVVGLRVGTFKKLLICFEAREDGVKVPGLSSGLSTLDAASLMAFLVNSSVFEDGSRTGACHPSAGVFPTLWALSGEHRINEVLPALTAGYQAMVDMATLGNPRFTQRGFHPTGITATYGAAAAAANLLGLDLDQLEHALILAASGSCGLMRTFREASTQPLHLAHAVRSGVLAALMARQGAKGEVSILEEGFLPAYLGEESVSCFSGRTTPWQGRDSALRQAYLKPYPGCRHIHPTIEALEEILAQTDLQASDIDSMTVETYQVALDTEIEPVRARGDAYFNIPYALAARMILGNAGWEAFDETHISDPEIAKLAERVTQHVDPEIEGRYPAKRSARVTVALMSGEIFSHFTMDAKGEPENPMTFEETEQKFAREARSMHKDQQIEAILGLVRDGNARVSEIFRVLTG